MSAADRDFWRRLRQARSAARLNQSELARRLKVRPQSVQQWESTDPDRRTVPTEAKISKLAHLLGVSERWLRFGISPDADKRQAEPEAPKPPVIDVPPPGQLPLPPPELIDGATAEALEDAIRTAQALVIQLTRALVKLEDKLRDKQH